eukprot:COSAG02_NODE_2344_length_9101_cov_11.972117_10_plen_119_part_00
MEGGGERGREFVLRGPGRFFGTDVVDTLALLAAGLAAVVIQATESGTERARGIEREGEAERQRERDRERQRERGAVGVIFVAAAVNDGQSALVGVVLAVVLAVVVPIGTTTEREVWAH